MPLGKGEPLVQVTFEELLRQHANNLALVIGNGINRHGNGGQSNSWDQLLLGIAQDRLQGIKSVPKGAALTEFYDVVELGSLGASGDLQAAFCERMAKWMPLQHHQQIMAWSLRHQIPVLTTNFDDVLSRAAGSLFQFPRDPHFTAHYPWGCHFGPAMLADPCAGFGIWHINGMARYKNSVRLGLTHYMGSVQRARGWLHGSGDEKLFRAKDKRNWRGAATWMHLVFNKPLMFVGLALEENEVFLRWLLIERAKYFKKFEERRQSAWYVYVDDPKDERQAGKLFFLEAMGVKGVRAESYHAIYEHDGWHH